MDGLYIFPDELRRAYESQPLALVYDQYIGGKVVPLRVSDGFCELVDLDRDTVLTWFAKGQFERVHPDDAGSLVRVSEGFIRRECNYDVIFRCRHADGYHFIHAVTKWQVMPGGAELAVVTYSDMSNCRAEILRMSENYRLFQKDAFYTDPLTGLCNINYLHRFGDERVHALRVQEKTPMLIYSDVNAMLSYNNRYGFAQGDALLKLIADELEQAFPDALIARGADDHFIVLDAFDSQEAVTKRLEAVNARVRSRAHGNTTGIQSGVYVFMPNAQLVEAMDCAKSALKRLGTDLNQACHFHSSEADEQYWNQRYILESFDTALEHGWIKMYYQAIMRVSTGKVAALEGLARWVDPDRGIISPGEFIPVLEKYHLLYRLDLYMAEQLCKEILLRRDAGLPIVPVSVNFSAQDFDHADIVEALNQIFERHHASKNDIIIEITEQDVATATDRFMEQLRGLRRDGYRVWIDDFGSGYSSLNILSQLDVDVIKFDLEFLRHIDENNGANRHIMRAMVDLSSKLGVRTLAEGVETLAQLDFLREIGCDFAQGFFFMRPESLEAIRFRRHNTANLAPCETPEERHQLRRQWQERIER